MAISPLALGIGLQGKYDYKSQAALEIARSKGRAKAEADAETAKAKKRAPYERALMKVDTSGLLPYQAKLIKEKYADALQSFEDAPDDYSLHATNMQDINSSSKAFRDQAENYKRLSLTRDRMPADEEALTIIGTLSDPKAIQEGLSKLGPASSVQFSNDQFLFSNPKYQGIGDSITKFVKSSMFDPEQGVNEFTIGDRKYGGADINKQVPGIITDNIMRTDNLRQSAINDYLQYAQTNNIPYDFSTPESTNEFLNNTTKYVNDNAKKYIDSLSKQYGGSKTQFTTNVSMGNDMTQPATLGGSGSINLQYDADPNTIYHATGLAGNALGNHDGLFAYTNRTFDMKTGNPIEKVGSENSTFNQIDAFYTLNKNIKFKGIPFKKGMIIPDEYLDQAIDNGYATVEILALGKEKKGRGAKSFYVPMTQIEQVRYMSANKNDRPLIMEAQRKQNEAFAALNQKQPAPSGNTGGSPAPAPKPKPKPTPPAPTGNTKPKGGATKGKNASGELKSKGVPKAKQNDFNSLID